MQIDDILNLDSNTIYCASHVRKTILNTMFNQNWYIMSSKLVNNDQLSKLDYVQIPLYMYKTKYIYL